LRGPQGLEDDQATRRHAARRNVLVWNLLVFE